VPYSATAHRLLISNPSDVLAEDIATVMAAIARWNALYGQQFGAVIVPTRWKTHAAAQHRVRPQASLNAQLVDSADLVIAIFWHRLGSPTGEAESGTLEEIDRAAESGAYVAILRCTRDIPHGVIDPAQMQKLSEFYERVQPRSLMFDYSADSELGGHVDAILSWAVTKSKTGAEASTEAPRIRADVWPRIESSESVRTDAKRRIKTRRRWALVLTNTGEEAARNVRHRLEEEDSGDALPLELDERRDLEVLAPGGEASYTLVMHGGIAGQARCVVSWEDSSGEHQNVATLRFF